MKYLILAFLTSLISNVVFLRLGRQLSLLDRAEGVQKFHKKPTPRIGGVAIYMSVILTGVIFKVSGKEFAEGYLKILVCTIPVFLAGVLEDLTRRVSSWWRLFGAFLTATLVFFVVSVRIVRAGMPIADQILDIPVVSFVVTLFAVAGVSHAFNIIDGFNGLTAGVALLVFGAYAYVSYIVKDFFLLYLSLVMCSSVLGFFVWNFPFGYIFLGDGGAYFIGCIAGSVGILLVGKHDKVAPLFCLLVLVYPVWETLFSIYRKKLLCKTSPFMPDGAHLHMLVYKKLVKLTFGDGGRFINKNAATSPYLWVMEFFCVVPAVLFWYDNKILLVCLFVFLVSYVWLYFVISKSERRG